MKIGQCRILSSATLKSHFFLVIQEQLLFSSHFELRVESFTLKRTLRIINNNYDLIIL